MRRVSVPEEHRLYLACSGTVDLQWRHQVNRIIVTKQGQSVAYMNQQKYDLRPDGSLVIKELETSDSGNYHCNDQLVADVEVLKGMRTGYSVKCNTCLTTTLYFSRNILFAVLDDVS